MVLLALGVVLLLAIAVGLTLIDRETQAPSSGSQSIGSRSGEAGAAGGGSARADGGCEAEVTAAGAVVEVARTGVVHWSGHIGAHDAWVAGKITEDEKAALYKRTKLAGPGDQRAFRTAVADYNKVQGACAGVPAGREASCLERLDVLAAAMKAGKAAMRDWDSHLKNMAAFAAGEFGVAHAQMLWDRAIASAPENINAFKRADKAVRAAPRCS